MVMERKKETFHDTGEKKSHRFIVWMASPLPELQQWNNMTLNTFTDAKQANSNLLKPGSFPAAIVGIKKKSSRCL